MTAPVSRRFALFRIGATSGAAAASAAAVAATPATAAVDTGPITPDDFLAASAAIGWSCAAGFHFKKAGGVHRMGVYEYYDHDARALHAADDQIAPIRLMQRVGKSGPDFWSRVGDRLWEIGKRKNMRPDYPPAPSNA